jgi:hypothetical protein
MLEAREKSREQKQPAKPRSSPTSGEQLELDNYRKLVGTRYLNASIAICDGLRRQRGVNDFHFLISLRSFIEYTRRGIWFLVWATDEELEAAEKNTFDRPGSPSLEKMDAMFNDALGKGNFSPLAHDVTGMPPGQTFLNALHALTHGNPISVRLLGPNQYKVFNFDGFMARAELEVGIFKILVYRYIQGEAFKDIWSMLKPIVTDLPAIQLQVQLAAHQLKESGKYDEAFQKLP